jgi:hypothetical protein
MHRLGSKTQSDDLGVAGLLYWIEGKGCEDENWIHPANMLPLATYRQHSYFTKCGKLLDQWRIAQLSASLQGACSIVC